MSLMDENAFASRVAPVAIHDECDVLWHGPRFEYPYDEELELEQNVVKDGPSIALAVRA